LVVAVTVVLPFFRLDVIEEVVVGFDGLYGFGFATLAILGGLGGL